MPIAGGDRPVSQVSAELNVNLLLPVCLLPVRSGDLVVHRLLYGWSH